MGTAIAIIPARGGSKRIPGKNIRLLAEKPIISYTIAAARDSALFERVVVSTDSPEIAEVARQYGAEVPFLRDQNLADDFTPVSSATADALLRLDPVGDKYDTVAQLMPCCPLRTVDDVSDSYTQFEETGAQSQISVIRYGWQNPWWAMRRNEQHELEPLFKEQMTARSQDLPELFCPSGAIWWARTGVLRLTKTFHVEHRTGWEIPWHRGLDIDTFEDWAMAEVLLRLPPNIDAGGTPCDSRRLHNNLSRR
ncbi:MAG: pseudaminic acid cytidylyltransferase [Terriglobales bacterium]